MVVKTPNAHRKVYSNDYLFKASNVKALSDFISELVSDLKTCIL